MSLLLKKLSLITALILITVKVGGGQEADKFDTCYTRSNKMMICPVFDTVKQLEKANQKADTILNDLKMIKDKLGIKDSKPDKNEGQ
jgi:hypothetical protein